VIVDDIIKLPFVDAPLARQPFVDNLLAQQSFA
jgi:hypothetical protein